MLLYDFNGNCCGNFDEEDQVPEGYWTRPDDAVDSLTALQFLDKIGPTRFAAVWGAALSNSDVAFSMVRGLAAQEVIITEAFPSLYALEQAGLLPSGTAIEIWS